MFKPRLLENGNILVPRSWSDQNGYVDGIAEIGPDDDEWQTWFDYIESLESK